MSLAALLAQLLDQLGHERLVARGLAADADDVDVVLDRVACRFLGRLEQRADVDVEAEIGERGRDHLGAAVVAVLAHLGDEHARAAALGAGELLDLAADLVEALVALVRAAVHARDGTDRGAVPREHLLHRVGDLADRRAGPGRLDRRARAGCRSPAAPSVSRRKRRLGRGLVARARGRGAAGRSAARGPRCCRCRGCRRRPARRAGTC